MLRKIQFLVAHSHGWNFCGENSLLTDLSRACRDLPFPLINERRENIGTVEGCEEMAACEEAEGCDEVECCVVVQQWKGWWQVGSGYWRILNLLWPEWNNDHRGSRGRNVPLEGAFVDEVVMWIRASCLLWQWCNHIPSKTQVHSQLPT